MLVFGSSQGEYSPSPEIYRRELNFETEANITLTKEEKLVLSQLSGEPVHIDEISARCGISTGKLFVIVTSLEMNGYIQSHIGKKYTVKI